MKHRNMLETATWSVLLLNEVLLAVRVYGAGLTYLQKEKLRLEQQKK